MCLSTAYTIREQESTVVCENVSKVYQDSGNIVLVDLFGEEVRVIGIIKMIDLTAGKIEIAVE